MSNVQPDVIFAHDETTQFEQDLGRYDPPFSSLAAKFKAKYLLSAARGWPGRRIRKRVWFRTYELRLLLNPNYLQDGQRRYELHEQWMYDLGEVLTRVIWHRRLATYSGADMDDVAAAEQMANERLAFALGPRPMRDGQ